MALILLSAGVGAFLGTSLLTTRLVVDAQAATRAMQAAGGRLEQLRALALTAPMHCAALSDGADSTADGIRVAWRVRALGQLSEVTVVVAQPSRLARGTDSVTALLRCP